MAWMRTYTDVGKNEGASGTFGQFIPGVKESQMLVPGKTGWLVGLRQSRKYRDSTGSPVYLQGYRTNLGLLNVSDVPAVVKLETRVADRPCETTLTIPEHGRKQLNQAVLTLCGWSENDLLEPKADIENFRVKVTTSSTGAKLFAWASLLDNLTTDPIFVRQIVP
jgi:hypothetical protein